MCGLRGQTSVRPLAYIVVVAVVFSLFVKVYLNHLGLTALDKNIFVT